MFVQESIDTLLEKLEQPQLVYYDFTAGVSIGEALQHPHDDFRFWINSPNKPLKDLYCFIAESKYHFLHEPIFEMVANSVRHGNSGSIRNAPNGDPLKSLSIKVFEGNNGVVVRVRNEGTGFDYQAVLQKINLGNRHSQNVLGGNGLRMLAQPYLFISYEDKGRAINLLYL